MESLKAKEKLNFMLKQRPGTDTTVFQPFFTNMPRFRVEISIDDRIKPKPHDRSIKRLDIFHYIQLLIITNTLVLDDVNLHDFYVDHPSKKNGFEISNKGIFPKGFSTYTAVSFVDENRWCCWFKKPILERDSYWVNNNDYISERIEKKDRIEPIYKRTRSQSIQDIIKAVVKNTNEVGKSVSVTRRLFGFEPSKQKRYNRPFFTIFITVVQIIVFVVVIATHGIAHVGINYIVKQSNVFMPDSNIRSVQHYELPNLWIGPKLDIMIRLGARFAPCIKTDPGYRRLQQSFQAQIAKSGCCVQNDGSGCVQYIQDMCGIGGTWHPGTVCGLDQRYCLKSDPPLKVWPMDLSLWPNCIEKVNESEYPVTHKSDYHMFCHLLARPCCIGMIGVCIMTTEEYCKFKDGFFNPDKYLCSQVSCMEWLCGMTPFSRPKQPNQFYRFFSSLIIIPGILALVISILFQILIMYDIERLTGTLEMTIIYVGCGFCGSVFSSIFMPYYVEAGPSGSHYGVLSVLCVEVVRWNIQEQPKFQIFTIISCLLILFISGLIIPQIDNWAHLGGFIYGCFVSILFRPVRRVFFRPVKKSVVSVQRVLGLSGLIWIPIILIIVFYSIDTEWKCDICLYFNCLPFTDDYCEGTSISLDYNSMMRNIET